MDMRPKDQTNYGIFGTSPIPMRSLPINYQGQPGTEWDEIDWRDCPSQQHLVKPIKYEYEPFSDEVNEKLLTELRDYFKNK